MDSKLDPLCQLDIRMIKRHFGVRFNIICAILNKHDPMRLRIPEAPDDVYESETKTIIIQLDNAETVEELHEIVYTEFARWFDKNLAGNKNKYLQIAQELFALRE